MEERGLSWDAPAGNGDAEALDRDGRSTQSLLPALPGTADPTGVPAEPDPLTQRRPPAVNRIRPPKELDRTDLQPPAVVDRTDMILALNDVLEVDPRRTAVITIDCHRGHLDLAVATLPVAPQAAATVVANLARLLRFARGCGMSVIHVVSQNRILPEGRPELLCNPFWASVEGARQMLTPDRESTISRHNLVGTVQTQLMPELGPEPGDVLIDRQRRLSVYRETDLDLTLRELRIDTVVLTGINSNTSVLCAAFESMNRDLRTIVVSDCVASMYGEDLHFFALQNVARSLGWVLSVEELAAKVEARRVVARAR
jgi:nicotinamidase-related amidase